MIQAHNSSLEISIWDFCSDSELKPLNELILRKYTLLRKYRNIDLFSLPQNEAAKQHRRLVFLEEEITTLYATRQIVHRLREVYQGAVALSAEAAQQERHQILLHMQYWKKRFEHEHAECVREKEEVIYWVMTARNYLRNGTQNQ